MGGNRHPKPLPVPKLTPPITEDGIDTFTKPTLLILTQKTHPQKAVEWNDSIL